MLKLPGIRKDRVLRRSRTLRARYQRILESYRNLSDKTDSTLPTKKILEALAHLKKHSKIVERNINDEESTLDRYIYYELTSFYETDLYIILTGHLKQRKVRRCRCALCSKLTYKLFQIMKGTPKRNEDKLVTLCPLCYLGIFKKSP